MCVGTCCSLVSQLSYYKLVPPMQDHVRASAKPVYTDVSTDRDGKLRLTCSLHVSHKETIITSLF